MFVERVTLANSTPQATWPFTIPAVSQLAAEGLEFRAPVTFLVGDNGSGKSTIVEAIAEGFGLDSRGDRASRTPRSESNRTLLGEAIKLETTYQASAMLRGPRLAKRGFFLRAETAVEMTEKFGGRPGYWREDTSSMSHGEGFMAILNSMFKHPGFYVLDEPESALSFTACLQLVALLDQLGESGAQIVCATHSPVLASLPGADIVEVGDHGFRRSSWSELDLVKHWTKFLNAPESYLRHLLE